MFTNIHVARDLCINRRMQACGLRTDETVVQSHLGHIDSKFLMWESLVFILT